MGKNGDIIKELYDAFGRGDVPAVLAGFDPAIEWWEAEGFLYAEGNPYVGPQGVAEGVFQRIVSDVQDFTVTPESFIDSGEVVVVQGRYTGAIKGTPLDAQFAHVWTFRTEKVTRFQQYTDTKQWAEAMGA
jgi:ketosteroid isomerase-like protein